MEEDPPWRRGSTRTTKRTTIEELEWRCYASAFASTTSTPPFLQAVEDHAQRGHAHRECGSAS